MKSRGLNSYFFNIGFLLGYFYGLNVLFRYHFNEEKKNNIIIYWIIIGIILIVGVVCGVWYIYGIDGTIDSYGKVDSARIEECKKALERCLEMNRNGSNQICPQMLSNGDCNIRR